MKLDFEWLEAPGVEDPAEAATWAEMRFEIAGVVVSELHDERCRAVRSGFAGSVLPLAEWLVDAWPRLVHERRVPIQGTDDWWEWRGYHRFRTGRRGGAMPDLELVRFSDDTVELEASADEGGLAPGMTVRFLRSARARVPLGTVVRELGRFLESVVVRLEGIPTTRAESFRVRMRQGFLEDRDAVLGRLGLPEATTTAALEELLAAPEREALFALIEASAADSLDVRMQEARAAVHRLPSPPPAEPRWRELEQALVASGPAETAWIAGWAAAQRFRELVELPDTEPVTDEILRDRCGWDVQACLHTTDSLATGVDTVHVLAPGGPPHLVTTLATRPAQAFRRARSLYHGLFGGAAAVVADSRMMGSRFSEANAFAAELVAPVEQLRRMIPHGHVWEQRHLEQAGRVLGVNPQVVLHQVENRAGLGVLEIVD